MTTDLFESLQSDPILLPQGLRITQQMADAVENCWDRRIYHVDLRITNILVTTLLSYITILNPFQDFLLKAMIKFLDLSFGPVEKMKTN